ncbi:ABC transporter ATP-binding protein [Gottschalkia purinilytica]|uniref:ABC transporter ATP-binding protein n=1 Tax=Gottschalkia purinilytica TaxID=1503 RepID=A0A0L0W870_GOTPU|nr:ABC transporter ATP-binding protein [Gottschalkia purinilytica]KNF07749.1 ABC transporter ATP-binding protein [Gottschalkia purinilytica]
MKNVIEITNLNKIFKAGKEEVHVLKDINLNIEEGSFASIMGPSGGGKSTLLYIMGGLDNPSSGNIKINGKEFSLMSDKEKSVVRRRNLGFVFQFYNLVPNLSVEENILLPVLLDGKKLTRQKETLDELLDIVELTHRRKHTPRELSGGQQQRVAIARALINNPEVILADEPIGNLDSKTGTEVMNLFQRINKEKNKTIVQVTHSHESAQYGSMIINIKDGKIVSASE